jgi:hypothetical protein
VATRKANSGVTVSVPRNVSASAGYSGTPLAKKLGIRVGSRLRLDGAPPGLARLLEPLPADVHWCERLSERADIVHVFATERATLARTLASLRGTLDADAAVWVAWPKRAAKVRTDITEDTNRELALPLGFVDVKVCAIDATWSGLKLVVRKALR